MALDLPAWEAFKFTCMKVFRRSRVSLARRIATMLAALGLLFAATIASVSHSIAMPLSAMMPAIMDHAGHDTAMQVAPSHDHDCDSAATADDPVMPMDPCKNGCLLCKTCSLASAIMPVYPALAAAAPYREYRMAASPVSVGIAPNPPKEPPRP